MKWLFRSFAYFYGLASMVAQQLKHLPGMRETQVRSLDQEDPLEKEMATHSSTLAWRIPWREEPGRLQSMGSQRVGHNWLTSLSRFILTEFWEILHIVCTNPLIFSWYMAYFFILLNVFWGGVFCFLGFFNVEIPIWQFTLLWIMLLQIVHRRYFCLTQTHKDFTLCLHLELLPFQVWYLYLESILN